MSAKMESVVEESPFEPGEVVTIGLYCTEANAGMFDMAGQIKQIEHIRAKITAEAIKAKKKPPQFVLSVLLVPDWKRADNHYGDKMYHEAQEIFFKRFREEIASANCGFKLQNAYDVASEDERGYLHQLRNMGANADWIKTHALATNGGVKHLQLDSNTQIDNYTSFYAHTFGQDQHDALDALNASAYDDNSAYVSAHNKVVYTVPKGKIVGALSDAFLDYCAAHRDPKDPDKDKNSIYSKVFCPSLAKIGLTKLTKVKDPKEGLKDRYLVDFTQHEYLLTQDIITAVNMSWAAAAGPDPYAVVKRVPPLKYGDAEITFPCFINLVNVHTAPFIWHGDSRSVEEFRNVLHNRKKDIEILGEYYKYIAVNRPYLLLDLAKAIPQNSKLSEALCRDAFGCTPADLLERADLLANSKEAQVIKFKCELQNPLEKAFKEGKGLGKDPAKMSEDEQLKFAMMLSLRERSQGFNLEDNRFMRLGLSCENVLGDGFCLFRAIAKQIADRRLNAERRHPLAPLPVTMEGVLERVAFYFSQNTEALMDRIYPPPLRAEFGTGPDSRQQYEEALKAHLDVDAKQRRLQQFRDNFYEYINLGRYDAGNGRMLNTADWLPQVMSDVLGIDIDIYDGQRPGGGFSSPNRHGGQRIGIGRVNNNHYVSLNGNLQTASRLEQEAIVQARVDQARFDAQERQLSLLKGKLIQANPHLMASFEQRMLKSESFLMSGDFKLRQLVQAKKIGAYLIEKIQGPDRREVLKLLNEVKEEIRKEVLAALQPKELDALWKAVENLEGYEKFKMDLWQARGQSMQVVLYDSNKPDKGNKLK